MKFFTQKMAAVINDSHVENIVGKAQYCSPIRYFVLKPNLGNLNII
jgi:hypothetical protein